MMRLSRPGLYRSLVVVLATMFLGACSEQPQGPTPSAAAPDEKPWQANDSENPYVASGWTPGDKASWDKQLRSRAQSQNEYVKVN